jgi:hypothetical protein
MLKSVEGIIHNGKIDLNEPIPEGVSGRVIVTFLPASKTIRLEDRGIDKEDAADLRSRLSTFAEDWQRPEMDVYDVD